MQKQKKLGYGRWTWVRRSVAAAAVGRAAAAGDDEETIISRFDVISK